MSRWKQLWARKSLDNLLAEMAGEHRLHRVLGPISLTSLGVGAIIGAGIFAMTGRVAAQDAGPSIMLSFIVAGIACGFAALCYAEFSAMAPVAGSAYTYTYATLGEVWAWIIGWDLVLEYAMSCGVVAAYWGHYLDEFLYATFGIHLPPQILNDPFHREIVNGVEVQCWFNLPAIVIMAIVTSVLVIGIRESATTNAVLVVVKLVVVLFVIVIGWGYTQTKNWTEVPVERRRPTDVSDFLHRNPQLAEKVPAGVSVKHLDGAGLVKAAPEFAAALTDNERNLLQTLQSEQRRWGLLSALGVKEWLEPIDDRMRSSFFPYGLSGLMVGAALVFFAYIGFDSISTHAEEATNPQRNVPIGILASLAICTVLYMAVAAVISGMEPYPDIDTNAAVAAAFRRQAERDKSWMLNASAGFISTGALAGMTSVLLVTFLSQARIFLAMSRDGLLPPSIFAAIHPKFRTPHRSTILMGVLVCLVAGFTPITMLEEMVNIGTLMAFVMVCASVLMLRFTRPQAVRPFRCPAIYFVAPAGIAVNILLMLFLPIDTWIRLAVWLGIGMLIYFFYGQSHSVLGKQLERELKTHGLTGSDAPLDA